MKKRTVIYIAEIGILGLLAFIFSVYKLSIQLLASSNLQNDIWILIILLVLSALCRSLPVYFKPDRSIDASMITIFATLLLQGPYACTIVSVLSYFFSVVKEKDKFIHILNTPFYKTIFNASNFALTTFIAGELYIRLGGKYYNPSLPEIFLPALVFLLVTYFLNTIIIMMLISLLSGQKFLPLWKETALSVLPSLLAIAPIGYFIAFFFTLDGGELLAILFFVPLLFARYAFKLYLDSKTQYYKTVKVLTAAIEAKDEYTEGHSRRVEMYAEQIAREMKLSQSRIETLKVAALLHDIGKIGVDDAILKKPGRLSEEEWRKIQEHPRIGIKILEEVEFPGNVKDLILHHHERFNGTGYPDHVNGGQLSIESCILAVADAYDAMTSDRPYRKALPKEKAVSILIEEKAIQFHPAVVDSFLRVLQEK